MKRRICSWRSSCSPRQTALSRTFGRISRTTRHELMDYKASGVDIDAGNETVRRIRALARSTFTPGVLSDIGSFGGLVPT